MEFGGERVDSVVAFTGLGEIVDGTYDDGYMVAGNLVEDSLGVGDTAEDHFEVELLSEGHDGFDVVAFLDPDDYGALAAQVREEGFILEVELAAGSAASAASRC